MGPTRMLWNGAVQKRVAATSSVLSQIKGVKLTGWTNRCLTLIQGLRTTELELSKKFRMLIVWVNMIGMLQRNRHVLTFG